MRYFPWSKRKSGFVGLEFQAEGIACVAASTPGSAEQVAFLRYQDGVEPGQMLKEWVEQHQLAGASCTAVLGADQYQILLVEPPDVAEDELRGAIRWRLKDLLTIPVDKAIIDLFALPEDGTRANKKMVYVVAAERGKITSIMEKVAAAELKLAAIDIVELALRNVAGQVLSEATADRGIAVARVRAGGGSVFLYRHGNMYLTRNFALNYKGGLLDDLPEEALALELQRSLDYYERQMGQVPPSAVYVCGENVSEDKIGPLLRSSMAVQVQHLNPSAALHLPEQVDGALLQTCMGALGGFLRKEQAA